MTRKRIRFHCIFRLLLAFGCCGSSSTVIEIAVESSSSSSLSSVGRFQGRVSSSSSSSSLSDSCCCCCFRRLFAYPVSQRHEHSSDRIVANGREMPNLNGKGPHVLR